MPCYTDDALACSRSIVRDLLHQRYFPSDSCWMFKNRSKMQHFGRVRSVSCHTSCESVVHCLSAPLPESGHQAYTSSHAVNERIFFSSAKVVTLRESPLALVKNTKTWAPRPCQRRAICPQQPNIFLTSNDDDVDQSWKQGSFHWFLPRMPSDQKNGGSTLDAPRFAGRKEWPLKLFSSSFRLFAFSNRSCAHRFAPKWSAQPLTAPRQRSQ